jgi:hypothetical protein
MNPFYRAALLALGLLAGCFDPRPKPIVESPPSEPTVVLDQNDMGPFKLKPEWSGPCQRTDKVDVNLGHAPEVFVRAAHCQVAGSEPSAAFVKDWAGRLKKPSKAPRRIDVILSLCKENNRKCACTDDKCKSELVYSEPWATNPDLLGEAPVKKAKRDIGAVFMFFFNCPGEVNCKMDWANTHAPGMDQKHPLLGFGSEQSGYYSPKEPGFWRRELVDAKYAGLDFLLLNTYGPDIEDNKLKPLTEALASLEDPVKIAFFDDTWTWGEPWFSDFWKQKPDLNDPEKASALIYDAKWKPFFSQIDKKHWYRFKGRPFIYFYNGGKLNPRGRSSATIARLKEKFKADFGEEPFIVADSAYFEDKALEQVADGKYVWLTFNSPERKSRSIIKQNIIDHAMVKWDATGRDRPGELPRPSDFILKDSSIMEKVLADSKSAELLVIATWNDLGEGTGINRNYDYYWGGKWQRPDYFMRLIRQSQSEP